MNITTEYAALIYRSTPDNCRYVKRDGEILGAVVRAHDGTWIAYAAGDLLDLRSPLARDLPDMGAAVDLVAAAADREPLYPELERMAHAVEQAFVVHTPGDRATAIVAGARAMRDYRSTLALLDRSIDEALDQGLTPSAAWAALCRSYPDVHSNEVAERVAAAVIDRGINC